MSNNMDKILEQARNSDFLNDLNTAGVLRMYVTMNEVVIHKLFKEKDSNAAFSDIIMNAIEQQQLLQQALSEYGSPL